MKECRQAGVESESKALQCDRPCSCMLSGYPKSEDFSCCAFTSRGRLVVDVTHVPSGIAPDSRLRQKEILFTIS